MLKKSRTVFVLGISMLFSGGCVSLIHGANMQLRSEFFVDIMGISEQVFNQDNVAIQNAITFDQPSQDPFLPGHKRPALAFIHKLNTTSFKPEGKPYLAGYFEEMSLKELRKATESMQFKGGGIFNVIEAQDPGSSDEVLKKVDSGALQADPQNKDAVFQVASNFNGLEFADVNGWQVHDLMSYLGDKTQGPFASISAFPGLLLRDYYVFHDIVKGDTVTGETQAQRTLKNKRYAWGQSKDDKKSQTNNGQINFLENTNIPVKHGYVMLGTMEIDNPELEIENMKIGYHGDVQVTFGFKEYVHTKQEKINDSTQIINQVFTAAMDTTRNNTNLKNEKVAQAILQGAYEGTLRAAFFKGKKKVILTLIGGGVFKNDIRWIADVLKNLEKFIQKSGLDVTLIVFNSKFYTKPQDMWPAAQKTLKGIVEATGGSYVQYSPQNPNGVVVETKKTSIVTEMDAPLNRFASALKDLQ